MTEKTNNTNRFNETRTQTSELEYIENSLSGLSSFNPKKQQSTTQSSQNNNNNTNKK